jgi:hypothetical protein
MLGLSVAVALAAGLPAVSFEPLAPAFEHAAQDYRRIWTGEGPAIIAAIEAATGLPFPQAPLTALVREGPSMIAFDGSSMRLRASHGPEYKKAVLVHELGHRLALTIPRRRDLDDHRLLYLFLYDVWSDLYGLDFADRMVAAERRSTARYDYDSAWTWALSMSRSERQTRLKAITSGLGRRTVGGPPFPTVPQRF